MRGRKAQAVLQALSGGLLLLVGLGNLAGANGRLWVVMVGVGMAAAGALTAAGGVRAYRRARRQPDRQ